MTSRKPNVQTTAGQAQLKEKGVKPLPKPDDLTRPYWEAAARHELHVQRCAPCGEYAHPPKHHCPHCASDRIEWARVSGKGTVYSFIIDRRLMVPGFDEPYVVAQVNPIEAQRDTVRITANIRGCDVSDVYIGMPVEVIFEDLRPGVALPQFRPASGA